jgi:hypothetical protein
LTVLKPKYMKNISKEVNLRTRVDAMFATTVNCVNSIDWHYIVDFLSNNRKIEFTLDVRKEIENKLEKQYEKD